MLLQDPGLLRGASCIDGAWPAARGGARFVVEDPARERPLAEVADAGAPEAEDAIAAAAAAWPAWRALGAHARADRLLRWSALIAEHAEDLARLMTAEQGKPLAEARGEVAYGNSFVRWFGEEARRLDGQIIAAPQTDRRILATRQPVGVCALITPWNFPIAMITRKAAPALAAGCTVVIKPSELTPLCALALAELALRAGIPPGVLNVVAGRDAAAIGAVLTGNPVVRKLSFTGSTAVGRRLMAQCAPTLKALSMELGGNAPFIVFDDADLERALDALMLSKFRNAGQTCVCPNRVFVQDGVHDRFVEALRARVAALSIGPGDVPGVQIGPLVSRAAVAKVQALLDDARAQGARVVQGGGVRAALGPRFVEPTVLVDVRADMRVACEEVFGPVVAVQRFDTEDAVVARANASEHGLAGYACTHDAARIWRLGEALEVGMLGINEGGISSEVIPFGGIKQSGFGREGSHEGIDAYLTTRAMVWGGLAS